MAAYPFLPGVKWSDFKATLINDHGVEEEVLEMDGEPLVFIFRMDGSTKRAYKLPIQFRDGENLMPTTVRGICEALGVDVAAFGFNLG